MAAAGAVAIEAMKGGGLREATERLGAGPAAIAYLGNSVTAQRDGYRPHLHAGLVKRFGHDHRAVNAGFGGVGSIGSVCTMDDLVIRHRPALCFIECMTGDMGVGLHADTGPALEGMLRKLGNIGCSACFLNLPRRNADFSNVNPVVALYARVAEHYGTPSVELGQDFKSNEPAFFRDVVHTTAAGGRRIADRILETLDSRFGSRACPLPSVRLFSRDFSSASVAGASTDMVRDPAGAVHGRFRLNYPFIEIGPENEIRYYSTSNELLGLLVIVGPHAGPTAIGGVKHQLRDKWSHYERLHAYVFEGAVPAGRSVAISPLNDVHTPSIRPRLKIVGFLVRRLQCVCR